MQIASIFVVTTKEKKEEVKVSGYGEESINFLRKQFPRYTKFVLKGFEINGKFVTPRI